MYIFLFNLDLTPNTASPSLSTPPLLQSLNQNIKRQSHPDTSVLTPGFDSVHSHTCVLAIGYGTRCSFLERRKRETAIQIPKMSTLTSPHSHHPHSHREETNLSYSAPKYSYFPSPTPIKSERRSGYFILFRPSRIHGRKSCRTIKPRTEFPTTTTGTHRRTLASSTHLLCSGCAEIDYRFVGRYFHTIAQRRVIRETQLLCGLRTLKVRGKSGISQGLKTVHCQEWRLRTA